MRRSGGWSPPPATRAWRWCPITAAAAPATGRAPEPLPGGAGDCSASARAVDAARALRGLARARRAASAAGGAAAARAGDRRGGSRAARASAASTGRGTRGVLRGARLPPARLDQRDGARARRHGAPARLRARARRRGAALVAWRDPDGRPVVERVWRREELYRGPAVERAPDLLLELATLGGYSYVVPAERRPRTGAATPRAAEHGAGKGSRPERLAPARRHVPPRRPGRAAGRRAAQRRHRRRPADAAGAGRPAAAAAASTARRSRRARAGAAVERRIRSRSHGHRRRRTARRRAARSRPGSRASATWSRRRDAHRARHRRTVSRAARLAGAGVAPRARPAAARPRRARRELRGGAGRASRPAPRTPRARRGAARAAVARRAAASASRCCTRTTTRRRSRASSWAAWRDVRSSITGTARTPTSCRCTCGAVRHGAGWDAWAGSSTGTCRDAPTAASPSATTLAAPLRRAGVAGDALEVVVSSRRSPGELRRDRAGRWRGLVWSATPATWMPISASTSCSRLRARPRRGGPTARLRLVSHPDAQRPRGALAGPRARTPASRSCWPRSYDQVRDEVRRAAVVVSPAHGRLRLPDEAAHLHGPREGHRRVRRARPRASSTASPPVWSPTDDMAHSRDALAGLLVDPAAARAARAGPPGAAVESRAAWDEGLDRIESIYRRVLARSVGANEPMMNRPRIAITMGDAAGIGPEITVKSLADPRATEWCVPLVIGDARVLEQAMDVAGTPLAIRRIGSVAEAVGRGGHHRRPRRRRHRHGGPPTGARSIPRYGDAAVRWTKQAGALALAGDIDAMVSAPLNKEAMHEAGPRLRGADGDPGRHDPQQAGDGHGRRPHAAHAVHQPHGAARGVRLPAHRPRARPARAGRRGAARHGHRAADDRGRGRSTRTPARTAPSGARSSTPSSRRSRRRGRAASTRAGRSRPTPCSSSRATAPTT